LRVRPIGQDQKSLHTKALALLFFVARTIWHIIAD
jgi:hypothetical protein